MLDEVNPGLFTLCEDAATDIFHPLLETLRAEYENSSKADFKDKEEAIVEAALAKLSNAERFALYCYVIEQREDVSDDAVNPLPDDKELKELFLYLWHCALEETRQA